MKNVIRFVACAVAISAVACNTDPQARARKSLARGDAYAARHDPADAAIEYRKAIADEPRMGEAHYKLAELLAADDVRAAYQEYIRAADLMPERDDIQLKVGNLLLVAGQFNDAKARSRTVLQRNPRSVPALLLLGNALAGLREYDEAINVSRRAASLEPRRSGIYRNIGVLKAALGDTEAAEAEFRKALAIDPKSVAACLALAQLLRGSGRAADAEPWLRRALEIDPANIDANQALAALYIDTGRMAEAEPYVRAAAKLSNSIDASLGVADYLLAMGRLADAERELEQLAGRPGAFALANARRAVIEYLSGRKPQAYELLSTILKEEPQNAPALAMRARLLLSDNDTEGALAAADAAINADRKAVDGYLIRGRILLERGDVDEAARMLRQASDLDPHSVPVQVALSALHLQRGEITSAIDVATQGTKSDPDSLAAHAALARSLMARADDYPKAEAELKSMLARFPRAPEAYDLVGRLALLRHDVAGAQRAWNQALQIDPVDTGALSGIAAVAASSGKLADARALIEARLASHASSPGLLLVAAKVRIASNDLPGAETVLKQLIQIEPANLGAYTMLGRLYVLQHRTAEAKAEFMALASHQPHSPAPATMVGLLCEADHDLPCAIDWYGKAVQINQGGAVAANNLAWIYVTQNRNLDIALQLAQSARNAAENQPEFNDTLGWIYYKKGLNSFALRSLKRAVELAPSDPVAQYHLGMTYAQNGDDAQARQLLTGALKRNPAFPGAEEARRTLQTLVY